MNASDKNVEMTTIIANYKLHALGPDDDGDGDGDDGVSIDDFLDHLAEVFGAPKAPGIPGAPRGLFADHWENDPDADREGVLVARSSSASDDHDHDRIVSSVRVYTRTFHMTPRSTVRVGAIGDVATHVNHRGKGLASKLMRMADEHMLRRGFPLATLHAAAAAVPMYASLGYTSIPITYNTIELSLHELRQQHDGSSSSSSSSPRPADFGSKEDVRAIRALYGLSAPSITGSVARLSDLYWTRWIPVSRDSRRRIVRLLLLRSDPPSSRTMGYISAEILLSDLDTVGASEPFPVTVREVFCGQETDDDAVEATSPPEFGRALVALLVAAIEKLDITHRQRFKVQVPAALLPFEVLDEVRDASHHHHQHHHHAWLDEDRRGTVADAAWMYKLLQPFDVVEADGSTLRIAGIDDLAALFRRPLGRHGGCGTECARTPRGGFLKADNL